MWGAGGPGYKYCRGGRRDISAEVIKRRVGDLIPTLVSNFSPFRTTSFLARLTGLPFPPRSPFERRSLEIILDIVPAKGS